MSIEQKLNEITNNIFNFECKSAVLDSDAGICFLEFYYNDGTMLSPEIKEICSRAVSEFLPEGFGYSIKYIKNFVTKASVRDFIIDYIKKTSASIAFIIDSVEVSDPSIIKLSVAEEQQEYIQNRKFTKHLAEALKERFGVEFNIKISYKPDMINFVIEEETVISDMSPKYIEVQDKTVVVGEQISANATYIRDSKHIGEIITICGKVCDLSVKFTRPKVKEGEDAEKVYAYFKNPNIPLAERKEAGQKQYFKFRVEDFTGDIICSYFPKAEELQKFEQVENGNSVILSGEVKEDKFNGITLKVLNLSFCLLPQKWEEEIDYKSEKAYYEFIKPKDLVYTDQVGLFSMFDTPKIAPFLKDNEIVVFDFETTGLNPYNGDRIVEIGAVKVVNGIISQSFCSLVNPEMHIPESSSAVHHILDEDVVNAPKAEQALQDFYKFTRNCILVGYNVAFDYGFLIKQGKESRYNFEAQTFDILELARKSIKGLKHYKLKDVCKYLGITLDNAHSALYDTIATAEVMIKLLNSNL